MDIPNMESLQQDMQQQQAQQQQQQQADERRKHMLDQILEPAAQERLHRLSIVKKEKAIMVGDALIKAATGGKLQAKVTEQYLIKMLEGVTDGQVEGVAPPKKVLIQRRKYGMDESDDDDDSDLM